MKLIHSVKVVAVKVDVVVRANAKARFNAPSHPSALGQAVLF
jgi:hypothetical protein